MPRTRAQKASVSRRGANMNGPGSSRPRSLGGCSTCRKRHVKCDESRPTCAICKHFGLACGGYKARILFDVDDEVDPEAMFRRPLYTDAEQLLLSQQLAQSVPQGTLNRVLMDLDETSSEDVVADIFPLDMQYGPFGVFGPSTAIEQEASVHTISTGADCSPLEPVEESGATVLHDDHSPLTSNEALDALFPDLFSDLLTGHFAADSINIGSPVFDSNCFGTPADGPSSCENQLVQFEPMPAWFSPKFTATLAPPSSLPQDALFLLSNYKDTVITNYLSPLIREKTLWHVLHVPASLATLGSITMGDDPGHASLAIFYAMLSISAFCLRGESSGNAGSFWSNKGMEFKAKAQRHLAQMLRDICEGPKRSKYKQVLMALMTMATATLFAGDAARAPLYLYDTDRFIRLKGLAKPKSRKVRLLHHQYGFLRLLFESTQLRESSSRTSTGTWRCTVPFADETSARRDRLFRLARWNKELDQKMLEIKDRERGENDLLLQDPGRWDATMYPEMFGVPESLLALLSQTIRLANERDVSKSHPEDDSLSWQEFSSRAQSLEKCISSWQVPSMNEHSLPTNCDTDISRGDAHQVVYCMLLGLHAGLRIYFYRRIYNVDPSILKQQVQTIRQSLEYCKTQYPTRIRYTAGFLWPAFIGACEALDQAEQVFFKAWFKQFQDCGFHTAQAALAIAEHTWKQRTEQNDTSYSWCDYLRSQHLNLMFL